MLRRSRAGRAVVGSNRARERFGRIGALGVFAEHRTHDRYDRASASDLVRVGHPLPDHHQPRYSPVLRKNLFADTIRPGRQRRCREFPNGAGRQEGAVSSVLL
jgi:hypothetical protein